MRAEHARWIFALVGMVAGCHSRPTSGLGDASTSRSITVHVPGALRVARAIDSLSVEIDPSSRADLDVNVDPGMKLGVATESHVFVAGESIEKSSVRKGEASGGDFDVGIASWSLAQDGVPQVDKKYVVEMQLVLFEIDASSARKTLLTRTLRQAEE